VIYFFNHKTKGGVRPLAIISPIYEPKDLKVISGFNLLCFQELKTEDNLACLELYEVLKNNLIGNEYDFNDLNFEFKGGDYKDFINTLDVKFLLKIGAKKNSETINYD
jgi:hypothetical protein